MFLNWLSKLLSRFLPPERKSITVPMFSRGMSAKEFRAFPDRVNEVRHLYKSPLMQDIFGVLRQGTPRGYPLRGEEVSPTTAVFEFGRTEGYQDCLDLLLALANYAPNPEAEVEPDWGARARMKEEGFPEQQSEEQMR